MIKTRVAHAIAGDNAFRGFSVNDELAGRDGWTSALSLALGGPRLDASTSAIIEDLAVCSLAADPRIWPLKMARLVASYGVTLPAMAVGHLALEGAIVGSEPTGAAAEILIEWSSKLGESPTRERLEAHVSEVMAQGRVPGFGVAFRGHDERVSAIKTCIAKRGVVLGRHWGLVTALEDVMLTRTKVRSNLAMASAAVLLDLGYGPKQIRMWMSAFLDVCFYANVVEAAEQKSPELLEIARETIAYVGRAPRSSPRALAKGTLDSQSPVLAETVYR